MLIHDEIHDYDSDAIKLAIRTFNRKHFNMDMVKYRKMNTGRYAYVFKCSRMK